VKQPAGCNHQDAKQPSDRGGSSLCPSGTRWKVLLRQSTSGTGRHERDATCFWRQSPTWAHPEPWPRTRILLSLIGQKRPTDWPSRRNKPI